MPRDCTKVERHDVGAGPCRVPLMTESTKTRRNREEEIGSSLCFFFASPSRPRVFALSVTRRGRGKSLFRPTHGQRDGLPSTVSFAFSSKAVVSACGQGDGPALEGELRLQLKSLRNGPVLERPLPVRVGVVLQPVRAS